MIIRLCLLSILLSIPAYSENIDKDEVANLLAQKLKLNDHPEISKTFSGKHYSTNKENLRIVNHFRFKEGIAFPKKADFEKRRLNIKPTKEAYELALQISRESELEALKEFNVEKKLPQCSSRNTKKAIVGKQNSKKINMDMLFIAKEKFKSIDPSFFGKTTEVSVYNSKKASHVYTLSNFEINCLPARVRDAGGILFIHTGIDALKNYDADLLGEGKLEAQVLRMIK